MVGPEGASWYDLRHTTEHGRFKIVKASGVAPRATDVLV